MLEAAAGSIMTLVAVVVGGLLVKFSGPKKTPTNRG